MYPLFHLLLRRLPEERVSLRAVHCFPPDVSGCVCFHLLLHTPGARELPRSLTIFHAPLTCTKVVMFVWFVSIILLRTRSA